MLIIVEGPDGAGKSSLVEALDRVLWKAGRGTVLVNHKAAPRQSALEEYAKNLAFYSPGGDVDLVLDRSWLSEDVYGPLWRGAGLPDDVRAYLGAWAISRGAVLVRVDAPDEVLVERVLGSRGDDLVTDAGEVTRLAVRYRDLFHPMRSRREGRPWPGHVVFVDGTVRHEDTVPAVLEAARRADSTASGLAAFPTYVGPTVLGPHGVLLVGDVRSDTVSRHGYVGCFPPTPGSAAQQVLWPAIVDRDGHFAREGVEVGLVNGCDPVDAPDLGQLWQYLGQPRLVALGRNAQAALDRAELQSTCAPHPAYVKRFFYARRREYPGVLAQAVAGTDMAQHFGPTDPARRDS